MRQTRNTILICGAYGMGNAGDEGILTAILQQVRAVDPQAGIVVLSRNPKETEEIHGVASQHMFDLFALLRVLRRTKLYINGGGSLIQDATSRRSLWYYLFTLAAAKRFGCKVLMFGCGIGPVTHPQDVRLTGHILNRYVDAITLREPSSLDELAAMGVTAPDIALTCDPALTVTPASEEAVDQIMERNGIPPHGNYLCLALRSWTGFSEKIPAIRSAVRYAYETYGLTPVFLAIERHQDPAVARAVTAELDIPCYYLDQIQDGASIVGCLSRMKGLLSMRLHALIYAATQGVPLAGIVYDPKVSGFLRYIGQNRFVDLASLQEADLKCYIDHFVLSHNTAAQADAVQRILELEHGNSDMMHRLLKRQERSS